MLLLDMLSGIDWRPKARSTACFVFVNEVLYAEFLYVGGSTDHFDRLCEQLS